MQQIHESPNGAVEMPDLPRNAFTYMEDKGVMAGQSLDISATAPSLLSSDAVGGFVAPVESSRYDWSVPAIVRRGSASPLWVVCRQERLQRSDGQPFLGGPELAVVDPNRMLEAYRHGESTEKGIVGYPKMDGRPVVIGTPGESIEVSARMGVVSIKNSSDASHSPVRVTQFSEERYRMSTNSESTAQAPRQSRLLTAAKALARLLHF